MVITSHGRAQRITEVLIYWKDRKEPICLGQIHGIVIEPLRNGYVNPSYAPVCVPLWELNPYQKTATLNPPVRVAQIEG